MMRRIVLIFIICGIGLATCQKEHRDQGVNGCSYSTPTRIPQNYYSLYANPIPEVQYNADHCGYLPLGKKNYWVYLDSTFDYLTGQFLYSVVDTLRFEKTFMTIDSIIWWKPKLSSQPDNPFFYKGYYDRMYATDSILYTLGEGVFGNKFSLTWCYPVYVDSVSDHCVWTDVPQAFCIGKRVNGTITVPAGTFSNCMAFMKYHTIGVRLDLQFKPGIGILRSVIWTGPNYASPTIILQTSTLLSYHLE